MATSAADPQGQEGHSLTRAGEDYLESIYRLSLESAEGDKSVRSVDVAEQLEVSKASVNKALSQLKEMGMVVQSRYGRVVLTEHVLSGDTMQRLIGYLERQGVEIPKE